MAQDSWPSPAHNSRAITDVEYEAIAARFSDDGVYGTPSDPAVVAPGTGLSVDIRAGVYASVRGHAWTSGTTSVNLPIAPSVGSFTRHDRVVLRLNRSDWTVRAAVKTGSPGGREPDLTQDEGDTGVYEVPLATVTLRPDALTVTVARSELYVGARMRPCTSTTRNPAPKPGELAFEMDTRRVTMWDGSAWLLIYRAGASETVDSPLSSWALRGSSVVERRGDVVTLRTAYIDRKGALSAASDSRLPILIPADYRHPYLQLADVVYLTGSRIGSVTIYPRNHDTRPGQVWLTSHPGMSDGDTVVSKTITWTV